MGITVDECCAICCAALIGNILNIVGIIYGFQEYKRSSCESNDICSTECNPEVLVDATTYLLIGCFSMIVLILSSGCCLMYLSEFKDHGNSTSDRWSFVCSSAITVFQIVWSSLGLVIYTELIIECKETPKGKMILSFSIIYLVLGC
eukprot:500619_1